MGRGDDKRLKWEDASGVYDNSKRQEELERTLLCVVRGHRPSATKMENDDDDEFQKVEVGLFFQNSNATVHPSMTVNDVIFECELVNFSANNF